MQRIDDIILSTYEQALEMLKQFMRKVGSNIKTLKTEYEILRNNYSNKIKRKTLIEQEKILKEYERIMKATEKEFRQFEYNVYSQPMKLAEIIPQQDPKSKSIKIPPIIGYPQLYTSDDDVSPVEDIQTDQSKSQSSRSASNSVSSSSSNSKESSIKFYSKPSQIDQSQQKQKENISFPKPTQPSLQNNLDQFNQTIQQDIHQPIQDEQKSKFVDFGIKSEDEESGILPNIPTEVNQINALASQSSKQCPKCQKKFSNFSQYYQHLQEKHRSQYKVKPRDAPLSITYTCRVKNCGEKFQGTFKNYRMHLNSEHRIDKWFCCIECPFKADEVIILTTHLLSVHGRRINVKLTIYKCPVTGKEFNVEKQLQLHVAETYEYHAQQPDGHVYLKKEE